MLYVQHTKKTSAIDDITIGFSQLLAPFKLVDSILGAAIHAETMKRLIEAHIKPSTPYGGSKRYREEKVGDTSTSWD